MLSARKVISLLTGIIRSQLIQLITKSLITPPFSGLFPFRSVVEYQSGWFL